MTAVDLEADAIKRTLLAVIGLLALIASARAVDDIDLMHPKATNRCFRCGLSEAELREADLSQADLREANLFAADLSRADLRRAQFAADLRTNTATGFECLLRSE